MNPETQRLICMKVLLISGVTCLAWMFLVKPVTQSVHDLRETTIGHKQLIVSFEKAVGNIDSQESILIQSQLESILSSISSVLNEGDSGTDLHGLVNEAASKNLISVTRIETIKESPLTQRVSGTGAVVKGVHHLIRIEFEGDYGSAITFMKEIESASVPVEFTSFRFIPSGKESVRVRAEISSVSLTSIPSQSEIGRLNHE